jgi:hypothetical integral membrane protein (TIGR02206 family)
VRLALAGVLVASTGFYLSEVMPADWTIWHLLPLHLCDALIFIALFALVTVRPTASELLYFWGASGTLLAMITPDLGVTWPAPEFLSYFALHGAVFASAMVVTFGLDQRPRRGAPWRIWLWTNAYAALVGAIDFAFDQNFLYLRRKPPAETPLDWMGPWPIYLLVASAIGLGLFWVLYLPARRRVG